MLRRLCVALPRLPPPPRARAAASLAAAAPVEIKPVEGAGRGLFATRGLMQGEALLTATPEVVHPTPASLRSVCHYCLRPLAAPPPPLPPPRPGEEGAGLALAFCGASCEAAATKTYLAVQRAVDLAALLQTCRDGGKKFPLVVARLAFQVLAGTTQADALAPLCFANVPSAPPEWLAEHALLRGALERAGWAAPALAFLTPEWYAAQTARLHLNAFRVELVRPTTFDPDALLRAAAAGIAGGGGGGTEEEEGLGACGSGVYVVPSFINHSCDPNLGVEFLENTATMTLQARREISAGEELTITYIDAEARVEARRQELHWGYGFTCKCPRCEEEVAEGPQPLRFKH